MTSIDIKDLSINVLNINNRALNCLRKAAIHTVGDLVAQEWPDLIDLRGFGPLCLASVRSGLAEYGLKLAGDA